MKKHAHIIIFLMQITGLYGYARDPDWPTFELYTNNNKHWGEKFKSGQEVPSNFNRGDRTIFIVHGFNPLGIRDTDWMDNIKDAILDKGEYNVILVDWKKGAGSIEQLIKDEIPFFHDEFRIKRDFGKELFKLFEGLTRGFQSRVSLYGDAIESARYTGLQIAGVFRRNDLRASSGYCIGHSLGAHACGFAGKNLYGKLGTIVGLDPAGPGFTEASADNRLDASDADFVQVIHTDCYSHVFGADLPLGLPDPVGDVDFYPNGGRNQPGCRSKDIGCSHERAVLLFIASIKEDCFQAVTCTSTWAVRRGRCGSCSSSGCTSMGWAANSREASGIHWLHTTSREPFCKK